MTTATITHRQMFQIATAQYNEIESRLKDARAELSKINSSLGLVPGEFPSNEIRLNPERQSAKAKTDKIFAELQKFNQWYTKEFKKELKECRRR